MNKAPDAFRTISEVAEILETPAHVLRFWESRFPQIRPVKRAGGRRYYRPADVALLSGIRKLLHDDGLTIRGVQKILREQGVRHVAALAGGVILADADQIDVTIVDATAPGVEALLAQITNPEPAPPRPEPRIVAFPKQPEPRPVLNDAADETATAEAAELPPAIADVPNDIIGHAAGKSTLAEEWDADQGPMDAGAALDPWSAEGSGAIDHGPEPEGVDPLFPDAGLSPPDDDGMAGYDGPQDDWGEAEDADPLAAEVAEAAVAASDPPPATPGENGTAPALRRSEAWRSMPLAQGESIPLAARLRALPPGALRHQHRQVSQWLARARSLTDQMGQPPQNRQS